MVEENISQEFRLKNIDIIRNYFIEEINRNELITQKGLHSFKLYRTLTYFCLCDYWMCFNFYFCSHMYCKFCSTAALCKNLCNNCRN